MSGPGGLADLAAAIEAALPGARLPALTAGTQRLMTAYRAGETPAAPLLAGPADAAAYAAYRMPATAAAAAAALTEVALALPGWSPSALADFGAGTGAMAWAAAATLPGLAQITLLEQSAAATGLGRAIAEKAAVPALSAAAWRRWRLPEQAGPAGQDLELSADLATAGYLLGELTPGQQAALVALAARTAPVVLLVEPGTPAGHQRILAARDQLLAAGLAIAAPCPHQAPCPLAAGRDWCHFAARLARSGVHRQVKGGALGYEDEKFSYVAAVDPAAAGTAPAWPGGRIVRRPRQRKGLVSLELCRGDGSAGPGLIARSAGEAYRRARSAPWGARWD